ncbi:zinc-ribbon domain-containing protein [Candidatus Bathyarchaeota archaeon]|nr:zinc-ribbon domain-containing protein [Candidatus Bathyarchaeota archaeon]
MSNISRKTIIVDENLSKIIGVSEGTLVSYSEIAKGIHEYIKMHNLKKKIEKKRLKFCFKCGVQIPEKAVYCDFCGAKQ